MNKTLSKNVGVGTKEMIERAARYSNEKQAELVEKAPIRKGILDILDKDYTNLTKCDLLIKLVEKTIRDNMESIYYEDSGEVESIKIGINHKLSNILEFISQYRR